MCSHAYYISNVVCHSSGYFCVFSKMTGNSCKVWVTSKNLDLGLERTAPWRDPGLISTKAWAFFVKSRPLLWLTFTNNFPEPEHCCPPCTLPFHQVKWFFFWLHVRLQRMNGILPFYFYFPEATLFPSPVTRHPWCSPTKVKLVARIGFLKFCFSYLECPGCTQDSCKCPKRGI